MTFNQFEKEAFPHLWKITVMAREQGALGIYEPVTFERRERFIDAITPETAITLAHWRGLEVHHVISIERLKD